MSYLRSEKKSLVVKSEVYVLDASALLALLNNEQGSELVEPVLSKGFISSVNVAEVVHVLSRKGIRLSDVESIVSDLFSHAVPFSTEQAILTGYLKCETAVYGLSLGDCACLALAKSMKLPVLTCDRAWLALELGVQVELAR